MGRGSVGTNHFNDFAAWETAWEGCGGPWEVDHAE
jgi:hypothetical protein